MGNAHPSIAPYEVFTAADRPLVIAVGNDRQFGLLAGVLGVSELVDDERFATNAARVQHRDELRSILDSRLATGSAESWVAACSAVGVPAGLVNTIGEAFDFARSLGLDAVTELSDGSRTHRSVSNPIHLAAHPPRKDALPPTLGEHAGAQWHPF